VARNPIANPAICSLDTDLNQYLQTVVLNQSIFRCLRGKPVPENELSLGFWAARKAHISAL
jgi:hypothetical protein